MTPSPVHLQLALISHTNAGKTTLARTLMGVDVGEVRDAPHVTTLSESHTLLSTPTGDTLRLWDTPGFGDSVRLFKRLNASGNPIGWFMREVVDRYVDRPFWLSQQAIRTAKEAADVVLYLVNASEDPQDAGYLASEMSILQWLGKPVIVLLNQIGPPRPHEEEALEISRWANHLAVVPVVKRVLPLDAFSRCWVHERVFFAAVSPWIAPNKQAAYARLHTVWTETNEARLKTAMALMAGQIMVAAQDRERLTAKDSALLGTVLSAIGLGQRREYKRQVTAMDTLVARLNDSLTVTTAHLLTLYRLDAGDAHQINKQVQQAFVVREAVNTTQAGLLGGLISGAATGLSADIVSGGLSLGAGALIGGIVGALTAAGATWAFNATTDRQDPHVRFSSAFLRTQVVAGLLRYLAVIHHGRGRGLFIESEAPTFWQAGVETAVLAHEEALAHALNQASERPPSDLALTHLTGILNALAQDVLTRLYPQE
ncbi:MAG: DUF3482 domain-containing protein [Rhodoferax sp.]